MLRFIKRWQQTIPPPLSELTLCPLPRPLALDAAKKVLVFAPHPDDESLGCGGTLARLAQHCPVKVVLVTDGSGAGGLPAGSDLIRQQEFISALAHLGITDYLLLQQPDGAFEATTEVMTHLDQILRDYQPNWVFLPSPLDYHRDHVKLSHALSGLCQRVKSIETLLFYEIWAPLPASHVVDISAVVEQKRQALHAHATAMACADYEEAMLGLNRYRGLYLGKGKLAEAFYVESLPFSTDLIKQIQQIGLSLLRKIRF